MWPLHRNRVCTHRNWLQMWRLISHTHTPPIGHGKFNYHVMRLFEESSVDLPGWFRNGLREQARETGLGAGWRTGSGLGWEGSHTRFESLESLTGAKAGGPWGIFKIGFSRCRAEGKERGVRLKNCQHSNRQKCSQFSYVMEEMLRGNQILELFLTQRNNIELEWDSALRIVGWFPLSLYLSK